PFKLVAPVERFDERLGFAPAGLDDNAELEVNARAEKRFNLNAGAGSDLLEFGAALANQDCLLAIAFAINGSRDSGERFSDNLRLIAGLGRGLRLRFFKLLNYNCRSVGDFFAGDEQNAF